MKQDPLLRSLGLKEAMSLVIGTVIGTGVFLKAGIMSQTTGSPLWVLLAWIAAGVLSLAGAFCYAELGGLYPRAGGEYIYLREAYGGLAAFLYGWMRFWIGTPGSIAAYGVGAAMFLGGVVNLGGEGGEKLVAVGVILFFSILNCFSVAFGGRIQAFLTGLKIVMIVGLTGAIFLAGSSGTFAHMSLPSGEGAWRGWSTFGTAMLAALWAYDGWNNMPMASGEIRDPGKNIPRALILGMLAVLTIYALANLAYFYALPFSEVLAARSKLNPTALPIATKAAEVAFGPIAVGLLSFAFILSALGAMSGSILTGARIPFAMARDGMFFKKMGEVHHKMRSPVMAVLVQALVSIGLALSGRFDELTDYVVFAAWIFYALVTGALFVFRIRNPEAERPYRVPGYPVLPAVFLVASILLLGNTLVTQPADCIKGLCFIIAGVPVYYYFRRRKRLEAAASAPASPAMKS